MGSELKDISEQDYRALEVESFSSLKNMLKGPKYYFDMKKTPFKGNSSTDFGTAIHHLLQGHKDWVGFMNKTNKEKYAEFEAEFIPKTQGQGVILQQSYKAKFENIDKLFNEKPKDVEFIRQFQYEKAFVGIFEGVQLKGRVDGLRLQYAPITDPDIISPAIVTTLEIKTYGQGQGIDEVRKIFQNRAYDMQAYMYMLFTGSNRHYFVGISTSEPNVIDIWPAGDEFLEGGRRKLEKCIKLYKKHVVNNEPFDEYEEL